MTHALARRAVQAGAISLIIASLPSSARAQAVDELPELVVTASRTEQPIARAGSAVTVIRAEDIAAAGSKSVADVLRGAPGLDITEAGGPAGLSTLSLRGAQPGQVLVLIDGVKVGDPTSTTGEFDFGAFSVTDIDRIEILRGPQSALYGSDAMGGVVNIITRKGTGRPRTSLLIEAGSYGTLHTRATTTGSTDDVSWAFSVDGFSTRGFSRYGYRIPRILAGRATPLEDDPARKLAATGRVTWRPAPGVEVELGGAIYATRVNFDNPGAFGTDPDDRFNRGRNVVGNLYAKTRFDALDGRLRNTVTLFAHRAHHENRLTQSCFDAFFNGYDCNTFYDGARFGAEYQGELSLGAWGTTIFGLRSERETAKTAEQYYPLPKPRIRGIDVGQTTNSAFLLHQFALGERLDLSLGGRLDRVSGGDAFATGRATVAYRILETGTKLRASLGTGAKAPTLYQRFSIYGDPTLRAEKNVGVDAGIDQTLFDGRAKLSATVFRARYRELIDFNSATLRYFNVARALMQGVELSGEATLVPDAWRVRASYTYQHAENLQTKAALLRRPHNKGSLSLVYTGLPKLELEARLVMIGARYDFNNQTFGRSIMPGWGRLDLRADYAVNDNLSLFGRIENALDKRYEEIRDYGTAGRSFYAGLKTTW
jgi:vitamin B12 transporter